MTNRDSALSLRFRPIPHPDWLPEGAWPFRSFGIEANDSLLAVTEAGTGPVLLFVHVGAWSFIWRDLITRLASDFRCIFFDAPGNGQTQGAGPVTMEGAAGAVAAGIFAVDLQDITLVAHDLGGAGTPFPPFRRPASGPGEHLVENHLLGSSR